MLRITRIESHYFQVIVVSSLHTLLLLVLHYLKLQNLLDKLIAVRRNVANTTSALSRASALRLQYTERDYMLR